MTGKWTGVSYYSQQKIIFCLLGRPGGRKNPNRDVLRRALVVYRQHSVADLQPWLERPDSGAIQRAPQTVAESKRSSHLASEHPLTGASPRNHHCSALLYWKRNLLQSMDMSGGLLEYIDALPAALLKNIAKSISIGDHTPFATFTARSHEYSYVNVFFCRVKTFKCYISINTIAVF